MSDEHSKILPECLEKFSDVKVTMVEVRGDVSHIKTRIDNGMAKTIESINSTLLELKPVIEHHSSIVKRIEDLGWWISSGVLAGLIGTMVWAVSKGYVPHF